MMGTPKPAMPSITVAGSQILLMLGVSLAAALLLTHLKFQPRGRRMSFSLRGLFFMMLAFAMIVGGIVRTHLAVKARQRYAEDMDDYAKEVGDNEPYHLERIPRPFYMGKYTVTQAQFEALMGNNPSDFLGASRPVVRVAWKDAFAFCKRLEDNFKPQIGAGAKIELPTEAQWEYCCRAGTTTRFNVGDTISTDDANFEGPWRPKYLRGAGINRAQITPAGTFKPNAFGLYDMHGNVCQWCAVEVNGKRTATLTTRGCSFAGSSIGCRSAYRSNDRTDYAANIIGFRVILTLP